jgi:hypothetical protein
VRSRSERRVLVALALLLGGSAAVAAQPIYTWVGPHGTVHYADVPKGPHARRFNPDFGASTFLVAPRARTVSPPKKAPPPPAPAVKKVPGLTPAQAEALCRATRERYETLRPVRRLRLYAANGKARYLTGQNLVTYKERAKLLMERFCASAGGTGRD